MAQKIYRKLQFDSIEKDLDVAGEEEDHSDSESEIKDQAPPTASPVPSGDSLTSPTREPGETGQKDPSVVVTRDYYGLAQTVGGNHSCLVLVTNRSRNAELRDPIIFTKKGYTRIPPDARIPPETSAYCAFRKQSIVIKGTSGVISYEYDRNGTHSKRFAVMWKVPYRIINREENQVALKWMKIDVDDPIDSNMHTTMELYKEMAKCDPSISVKGGHICREVANRGKSLHIVNSEDGAELDATFSGSCKAIVKVDFNFSP